MKKTPDTRLVQLNLQSIPASVKKATVSDRLPQKKPRTSSSDCESPRGAPHSFNELKIIQDGISDIRQTMVCKDVKDIVASIVSEIKGEIKKEILNEVRNTIMSEVKQSVTDQVKSEFESKIDRKTKEFQDQTKDISDGFNLDFETLREKFHEQAKELRTLKENMKQCQSMTNTAVTLANNNQQYSQKNNIKFTKWQECPNENHRSDLCKILKETVNVDLDAADILDIHRVPGGETRGSRPVIAKFRNTEVKIKVIKNRSKEEIKKRFLMHDHLTQMNAQLIRDLNRDDRIQSAWYYNGKIFAQDYDGRRHRFDILDSVTNKLGNS